MKKPTSIFWICAITFLIFTFGYKNVYSQTEFIPPNYTTQYPENGRYQILISGIKRADTFKLDRYSGKVSQKVITETEDLIWEEVEVNGHPENNFKVSAYELPGYYLFISGMTAKDVILVDVKKGFTWNLVKDIKTEVLFFDPILSEKYYSENIEMFKKIKAKNDSIDNK